MQEGSAELGAGHEDSVGQEEVTEERLCRASRMGDRWQVGLQRSSPLDTGTRTAGVPSPNAAMVKVPPMPSPCDCTPYPSQEHRNEDLLPTGPTDQAGTQSGQRQVPSPLPGCADHLMSQTGRCLLSLPVGS